MTYNQINYAIFHWMKVHSLMSKVYSLVYFSHLGCNFSTTKFKKFASKIWGREFIWKSLGGRRENKLENH